jgi:hypothetical protein
VVRDRGVALLAVARVTAQRHGLRQLLRELDSVALAAETRSPAPMVS